MKSGSLILLGPSGPVQTCNGIVLPFHFTYIRVSGWKVQPKCKGRRSQVQYNYITDHSGAHCALLGCYAASSVNFLPTFRDKLSVTSSGVKNPSTLEHATYRLSRNVGKKKYHYALRNITEDSSSQVRQLSKRLPRIPNRYLLTFWRQNYCFNFNTPCI